MKMDALIGLSIAALVGYVVGVFVGHGSEQRAIPSIVKASGDTACIEQVTWDGKVSYSTFCTAIEGIRCSNDLGRVPAKWFPARSDGVCYAEDGE